MAPQVCFCLRRYPGESVIERALVSGAAMCVFACSAPPPAAPPAATAAPQLLFMQAGCGGCHTLAGVPGASGVAGPNLTNISLRPTLAGDSIPNTPEALERWLLDPSSLKPDARMPSVGLTQQEARELALFLVRLPASRP
jgi:cytochrome c